MNRKTFFFLILFIFTLTCSGCGNLFNTGASSIPGLQLVSSYDDGKLYVTNTAPGVNQLYVVQLKGTFYEMGMQYGFLTRTMLAEIYQNGMDYFTAHGASYEAVAAMGQVEYDVQYDYMKDLINGMAETSGLGLEKQKIVSGLMGMLFGCSGIAAWGDYTTDGALVFGRNWDTAKGPFSNLSKYVTVVVYNPTGYSHSVVDINYLGSIAPQTLLNDAGLFIDLQNGQVSDPHTDPSMIPTSMKLFSVMLEQSTLDGINAAFDATQTNMGLIINAAGTNDAFSYEWATYGGKRRGADTPGLLSTSNHFVDPRWTGLPTVAAGLAGGYTLERRANLLALGNANKGSINAQKMMDILDTTIPLGGPTFPDDSIYATFYQIVAVPSLKQLWVKSRGYSGWERIEAGSLFESR
ncbi:MAG: C45 family autoproteolytic acyltransferase/hydrolase [Candidatus Saganbacteria bacterium]|nr:C45 family autoproteolytic acyltransferase/hydrolase [Candidatus Saganbacteria bacterium]